LQYSQVWDDEDDLLTCGGGHAKAAVLKLLLCGNCCSLVWRPSSLSIGGVA
jgi:hypothetical protein